VRGFGTTKGERKNIWGRVGVRWTLKTHFDAEGDVLIACFFRPKRDSLTIKCVCGGGKSGSMFLCSELRWKGLK
jgi:hypothetical protein